MLVYAGTRGYLDKVAINQIERWRREFMRYMDTSHPEVGLVIRETGAWNEKIENGIKQALDLNAIGQRPAWSTAVDAGRIAEGALATERELNKRIKSVKNISQVTSALAAVSASKASRAQRQAEATRHYASKAFQIINNLAAQPGASATTHPLMTVHEEVKNIGTDPDHQ